MPGPRRASTARRWSIARWATAGGATARAGRRAVRALPGPAQQHASLGVLDELGC